MAQTIGTVLIDVKADTQQLVKGMNKAEASVSKATKTMKNALLGVAATYLSFQGINAFGGMIKGSIDAADSVGKLSEKLAISAQSLSELQYAAGFADVSINQLNASMSAMIRRTGNFKKDGTGAASKAMEDLGISMEFARENFTDTETTFKLLIDRLGGVDDAMLRTKIAQDLFSKSAADVVRLAGMGTDALESYYKQGKLVGAVITDDMVKAAAKFNDDLNELNQKFNGVTITLANDLLPALSEMVDFLDANLETIGEVIKQLGIIVGSLLAAKLAITAVNKATMIYSATMLALGGNYAILNAKIILATASTKVFSAVLKRIPFIAVAAGIIALANSYSKTTDEIKRLKKETSEGSFDRARPMAQLSTEEAILRVKKQIASAQQAINRVEENGNIPAEQKLKIISLQEASIDRLKTKLQELNKVGNIALPTNTQENKKQIVTATDTSDPTTTSLSSWQEYYTQLGDMQTAWLFEEISLKEKWVDLTAEQYDKAYALAKEKFFEPLQQEELNIRLADISEDSKAMEDMLNHQLELLDATDSWGNSLGGVAQQLGNVLGATNKLSKISLLAAKKQLKTDTKLAKAKEEFGEDSIEYQESLDNHIMETSDNKLSAQQSEIQGYGNLAGAMSMAFEEGSKGAKAFAVAQNIAAIASGAVSIMSAGSGGDPYTVIPRMLAAAATVASLLGSGGGGGGSVPIPSNNAELQQSFDIENDAVLGRMDRQTAILEAIEQNGTLALVGLNQSKFQYGVESGQVTFDIRQKTEDRLREADDYYGSLIYSVVEPYLSSKIDPINFFQSGGDYTSIVQDKDEYDALYKDNFFGGIDWETMSKQFLTPDAPEFAEMLNDYQEAMTDFAVSTIDSIKELQDAGENFKEMFDDITGSSKYANSNLNQAFENIKNLAGNDGLTGYIEKQITNIDKLNGILDKDTIDTLLDQSVENMDEQLAAINSLSAEAKAVLQDGTEEALNYIDAIELVAEAMTTSRENINSLIDNFRSSEQLARIQAESMGVVLAETAEVFFSQFDAMKNDILGLTDEELAYLETAKDYIENKNADLLESQQNSIQAQIDGFNELTTSVTADISVLNTVLGSLSNIIDKLRGASSNSGYSLNKFYDSMSETIALANGDDLTAYKDSLTKTIGYSSALLDSGNFTNSADMEFAQSLAANQFEDMQVDSESQLSVLEDIKQNTADTVTALTAQLQAIGNNISGSNSSLQEYFENNYSGIGTVIKTPTAEESQGIVRDTYKYLDIDKYQTDDSGYKMWEGMLADGTLNVTNIQEAIRNSAIEWLANRNIIDELPHFANGGIVTAPTMGLIGEAGYNEAVIPLKDPNDPLGMKAVLSELVQLRQTNEMLLKNIDDNTQKSYFTGGN